MTPSQQAKSLGLKSLAEVSQMTDTHYQKLHRWAKEKPLLFDAVLKGCMSIKFNLTKVL